MILERIFLLSIFFPFVSIFPVNTDVQPVCGFLGLLVCIQAYIKNQLFVSKKILVIIFFVLLFVVYSNIFDDHLSLNLSKHIVLVFGLFTLIAFYKTHHLLDKRLMYFVVFTYFLFTCFMIIATDLAIYIQNFIVRNTNSIELGYRGVSTLATEPGLLGGLLVFFLLVIYELRRKNKLSKVDLLLLNTLVIFILLMTKSGTGYLYLVIFLIFLVFEEISFYRAIIVTLFLMLFFPLALFIYLNVGQSVDLESSTMGRGVEILLMLSNPFKFSFEDSSIMTRVVQLYLGVVSIFEYPLGVGSASTEYYSYEIMENTPFIREFYIKTGKDFGTNSSFSYMTISYGFFFWVFLLYLYFSFSRSSAAQKTFSFIFLAVSYSAAFPPIWVLLLLSEIRKKDRDI